MGPSFKTVIVGRFIVICSGDQSADLELIGRSHNYAIKVIFPSLNHGHKPSDAH